MAKQQWTLKSFSNHIDPEKEEQLKRLKLGVEDQVERILKITSDINHGNKERNLRKKSEAIELIQDFHKQYEKLYILYENLREKVKRSVDGGNYNYSPARDSDLESNYSAEDLNGGNDEVSNGSCSRDEFETSDVEDTLTCSSVVTKMMNSEPGSPFIWSPGLGDILRDLEMYREKAGKTSHMLAEIKYLETQLDAMKIEVSTLCMDKKRLEEEVEWKTNEAAEMQDKISGLEAQIIEMEAANTEREHMFSSISKQLMGDKENLTVKVHDLESKIESLSSMKCDLEEQINKLNHEASESNLEKEKLQENVSQLQRDIGEKENVLSTEQKKYKDSQTMMSVKMKSLEEAVESLKSELETLENERNGLQNDKKLLQVELEKEREQSSLTISHLEKVNKTNFRNVERKIEEMAIEFRKQFEDQYRLLSRRIRVAEQLQGESKEWYRKTRDAYEQSTKDLKKLTARTETELKNMKDLSFAANDLLTSIDLHASKFEECTANLQNRISKASCEINLAKNWAKSKNKALSDMKDNLDCLVVQLDDKEAKILASKEKVWKLENKVRELEEIIEEKTEEMLVRTEEKKEAIRQLCVWVDYHRGQSDFYKNMLSDMNARKRAS